MLWGAFFGTLPDLDVLASPWLDQAGQIAFHRGISHSILMMLVAALLGGYLLAWLHRRRGLGFGRAAAFVFLAWSTHVLIDCFTVYGTQVLAPFSSARVSFDNLFIIDLFFLLPMLVGLIWASWLKGPSKLQGRLVQIQAVWLSTYVALSFGMRAWAKASFVDQLDSRGVAVERLMVAPTLSNVFLWRMVAEREDDFLVAYWTPWDGAREPEFSVLSKGREGLAPPASRDFRTLDWFSKGWWVARREGEHLVVADLRFGEMRVGDAHGFHLIPSFRWRLRETDAGWQLDPKKEARPEVDLAFTLNSFWRRLQGGEPGYLRAEWRVAPSQR